MTGTGPPQSGGGNFCCVTGTGYTPNSERIPGPDSFFPFLWEWFFDDRADPGFWVAGQTIEYWVSFTQLEPGDQIEFFANGTNPTPCGSSCNAPFGSVTVLASVPAFGAGGRVALVLTLATCFFVSHLWRLRRKPAA